MVLARTGPETTREQAMNITSPILTGATNATELPGDTVTSFFRAFGAGSPDGGLGVIMSALAGVAAALAVAIALSVYFRSGYRSRRDLVKHGLAASAVLVLLAFVISDMRTRRWPISASIRQSPPSNSKSACRRRRCDGHRYPGRIADRPKPEAGQGRGRAGLHPDGRSILRGTVTLDYRTTERMMVLNLPGQGQSTFRLRLPASPSHSDQFGPWHLADGIVPANGGTVTSRAHDAFAIRYRADRTSPPFAHDRRDCCDCGSDMNKAQTGHICFDGNNQRSTLCLTVAKRAAAEDTTCDFAIRTLFSHANGSKGQNFEIPTANPLNYFHVISNSADLPNLRSTASCSCRPRIAASATESCRWSWWCRAASASRPRTSNMPKRWSRRLCGVCARQLWRARRDLHRRQPDPVLVCRQRL
jgi:hypothetical protein